MPQSHTDRYTIPFPAAVSRYPYVLTVTHRPLRTDRYAPTVTRRPLRTGRYAPAVTRCRRWTRSSSTSIRGGSAGRKSRSRMRSARSVWSTRGWASCSGRYTRHGCYILLQLVKSCYSWLHLVTAGYILIQLTSVTPVTPVTPVTSVTSVRSTSTVSSRWTTRPSSRP